MNTRIAFEKELKEIHNGLLKMGKIIEESIDETIEALVNQNEELAKRVIEKDDIIDKMELDLEAECIKIIALQQPIATDLRSIASGLKIITDLERIADHCSDISKYTLKLCKENYRKPLVDIPKMAKQVKKMVGETIESYIDLDVEKAKQIKREDDVVDAYFHDLVEEINEFMKEDKEYIYQGTCLLFIIKYLERMADHATNICGWIIYNVTGVHK
ncbi:phosphate signaling complex protein PhoU [Clostridium grantii]|uniref:Phosphate-specific transport system accessory protein PhoU n=1 Tax=Clostridium grantii DSM 8605 TaxID=1121316 RepID=A0A1M5XG88_9CLOT|nr:phosphate signaling complex protein PhoU [Clostridium grantii]SHH98840.1 phosphate uptake regulator, PhoU [Clostridium grantii DSM 8605]